MPKESIEELRERLKRAIEAQKRVITAEKKISEELKSQPPPSSGGRE